MATATITKITPIPAEIRVERGSRKSQTLRAAGRTPGIVYGRNEPAVSITLPTSLTESVLNTGVHVLDLVLNGKTEKVLIKEVQYDYLQIAIEHIDLLRIDPHQKVRVKVPLEFRGTPVGAKEGGILETQNAEIELEVLALEIPASLRVPVDHLEMHQMIHAKDVVIPAGAKLITHPDAIICQVRTVKEEVAVVEAEATTAEPEVIGKKKEEEGAEGAEGTAAAAKPGAAPAAGAKAAAPAAPAKK